MNVICLEDQALYALVDKVLERIASKSAPCEDKWISGPEAMKLLRITSKTTLQKLRDNGKIVFSQDGKMILYDRESISEYLKKNSRKPF